MKSVLCHIMSLYFATQYIVRPSGQDIDVHDSTTGELILALRDGRDLSEELGARDRFSLSPIPKLTRLYKEVGGKIVKDDKFEERKEARKQFLNKFGVVRSIEDLKNSGFSFDDKGELLKAPEVQTA